MGLQNRGGMNSSYKDPIKLNNYNACVDQGAKACHGPWSETAQHGLAWQNTGHVPHGCEPWARAQWYHTSTMARALARALCTTAYYGIHGVRRRTIDYHGARDAQLQTMVHHGAPSYTMVYRGKL